MILKQLLMMLL